MRKALSKIIETISGKKTGKGLMLAVVLATFLIGYNGTSSYMAACRAQPLPVVPAPPVIGGTCICCSPYVCPWPCDLSGTASTIATTLANSLNGLLRQASVQIEAAPYTGVGSGISFAVDTMVVAILNRVQQVELDIISWWQTMWNYNLLPAMQKETRQLNAANADQSARLSATVDAIEQSHTISQIQANEAKADKTYEISEQTCIAGTNAGGLGRATGFSKGVRKAVARASRNRGLNARNTPGASGAIEAERERHRDYENVFCDPDGGANPCPGGNPAYYNADTQVTRKFYNALTLNVDDNINEQKTAEALLDNMTGSSAADTISRKVLETPHGQETFLKRRSFLARHAALRSVPELMLGWRSPGGSIDEWTKALREQAGVPDVEISDNPSYREIVHTMTVDRFNSGTYANATNAGPSATEQEKLLLSSFYLMQLRDYYDLLEREALTLAVQVSMMAEQVPMPDPEAARRQK